MRLERWAWEVIISGVLLALAAWWFHAHNLAQQKLGEDKVIAANKAATERQQKIDQAKIDEAEARHVKDLTEMATAYNVKPATRVVCHAAPLSTVPATASTSRESGPPTHGEDRDGVHPDVAPALFVFAYRLDQAEADLRRLNAECN